VRSTKKKVRWVAMGRRPCGLIGKCSRKRILTSRKEIQKQKGKGMRKVGRSRKREPLARES